MAAAEEVTASRESRATSFTETTDLEKQEVMRQPHGTKEDPTDIPVQPAKEGLGVSEKEAKASGPGDEDMEYPHGLKLVIILSALCLAVFLVALDNTIISTAIPKITDHFNSITDIGWYGSSYFLTATATQPTFGRIYTIFSVSRIVRAVDLAGN
jgi:hypothetical protein